MTSRGASLRGGAAAAWLLAAGAASGCGTTLEIHTSSIPATVTAKCGDLASKEERKECCRFNEPGGIVVNQRARYRVAVQDLRPAKPAPVAFSDSLVGVDQERLLVVNYTRQLLASGTLALTLDDAQAVKTIEITSEPGETHLVEALGAATAANREVREAEQERRDAESK